VFSSNISSVDNIAGLVVDQLKFTGSGNKVSGSGGASLTVRGNVISGNLRDEAGGNTIDASLPIVFQGGSPSISVLTGTLTINSSISSAGGEGLVKVDPGAALLQGDNTYGGDTFINDGTLLINAISFDGAIPHNVTIGDGSGAANSAVLRQVNSRNNISDTAK